METTLVLENVAKSTGGDKYKWIGGNSIYIPQNLSRIENVAAQKLTLKIYDEHIENSLKFKLTTLARGNGGDKYICETNEKFIIYFPQMISRKSDNAIDMSIKNASFNKNIYIILES